MILRRMAEGIRAQNWFTVIIEVLIVVVGIFLGLQVTEWAQERQNRNQEQVYLQRVAQDLDRDYSNLKRDAEFAAFRNQEAIYLLNSQDFSAIDPCRFIFAAFTSTFFSLPVMNRQTFDEMVSSGGLTLVSSNSVKNALGQYYAYEVELNRAYQNAHTISHNTYAANVPFISVEWSRLGANTEIIPILLRANSLDDYPETCDVMPMDKIVERHKLFWGNTEVWGWTGPLSGVQAVVLANISRAVDLNREARELVAIELGEAP